MFSSNYKKNEGSQESLTLPTVHAGKAAPAFPLIET